MTKKNLADNEIILDDEYKALWSTDESEYQKDNINEKLCIYFNSIIKKIKLLLKNTKMLAQNVFMIWSKRVRSV